MTTEVHVAETETEEFSIDGKSIIAHDFVKVLPSQPGKKDGFVGVFRGIWVNDDGKISGVDVWGDKSVHRQRMRTFRPERIEVLSPREQKRRRKARRDGEEG